MTIREESFKKEKNLKNTNNVLVMNLSSEWKKESMNFWLVPPATIRLSIISNKSSKMSDLSKFI